MLIQIKGRRYCQTRLVEPSACSVSANDCYVLVAPDALCLLVGKAANVVEKAKANEVFDWLRTHKDLGVRAAAVANATKLEDDDDDGSQKHELFYSHLHASSDHGQTTITTDNSGGGGDEDERYELLISDTNMVYVVQCGGDEEVNSDTDVSDDDDEMNESDEDERNDECWLEPIADYWACPLSYAMLDERRVFVFDFGAELYVWTGRYASRRHRRVGWTLARRLYEETGYDYTPCVLSPLGRSARLRAASGPRPAWTIMGRQTQNGESVLFREKFVDWPPLATSPSLKKSQSKTI